MNDNIYISQTKTLIQITNQLIISITLTHILTDHYHLSFFTAHVRRRHKKKRQVAVVQLQSSSKCHTEQKEGDFGRDEDAEHSSLLKDTNSNF